MVEMTVDSVRINLATQQRVVILKATKQERYLFIWIAQPEAYAIAVELQGTTSPRPLTHDLLKNVIIELGAEIVSIVISDLIDDIVQLFDGIVRARVHDEPLETLRVPRPAGVKRKGKGAG